MDKARAIDAVLRSIKGVDNKLLNSPAALFLPSILEDGELPELLIKSGVLDFVVATDRRILEVERASFPLTWSRKPKVRKAYIYEDIRGIDYDAGSLISLVTIVTLDGSKTKETTWNVPGGRAQEIANFVEGKLLPTERIKSRRQELADRLEKNKTPVAIPDETLRIDARWHAVRPKIWGENMHSGERKMLCEILDMDEDIESLVGGTLRADTNRLHKHNGVAVATSKRVIFLDKGVLGSTEVQEIPYRNIEGITYSTGMFMAGVQITGRGMAGYRIEDIPQKDSVKPFVDCVRAHMETVFAAPEQVIKQAAPASAADEIEKLAGLLEKGFITQDEFDGKKRQLLGL